MLSCWPSVAAWHPSGDIISWCYISFRIECQLLVVVLVCCHADPLLLPDIKIESNIWHLTLLLLRELAINQSDRPTNKYIQTIIIGNIIKLDPRHPSSIIYTQEARAKHPFLFGQNHAYIRTNMCIHIWFLQEIDAYTSCTRYMYGSLHFFEMQAPRFQSRPFTRIINYTREHWLHGIDVTQETKPTATQFQRTLVLHKRPSLV